MKNAGKHAIFQGMHSDIKRMLKAPKSSFFLLGARGTGKSTWLRGQGPKDAYVINLLQEEKYQSYLATPKLFLDELNAQNKTWIIIDEIQRLPSLLNYVHHLIEEKKFSFILSGSSARKLKKAGTNLLGGRAYSKNMHPFLPIELKSQFHLNRALEHGLIPLIYMDPSPQDRLQAYVQTYLKEEIKAESLVRNLQGFARFLPIAAITHGQTLNMQNIASEAGVARTTVQGFYEILIDTLLGFFLPAFASKQKIREVKKSKFYFIDPGIVRGIQRKKGPIGPLEKGALFEGLIAQILRATHDLRDIYDGVSYWQPHGRQQTEVDFILERKDDVFAIEVKAKTTIHNNDLKGLHAFDQLFPKSKKMIVYMGDTRLKKGQINILPFSDFCTELKTW